MSQHPSLRSSDKDKQHRSVLKRHERVKILQDKEKWQKTDTVFGLPKVKVVRFKMKKEKAAAAETADTAVGAAPAAGATPGSAQGAAAGAKAAPKAQAATKGHAPSKESQKPQADEGKK